MRIHVYVKPHAHKNQVVQNELIVHNLTSYTVSVQALPVDGKANEAVIALLAKHFGVKKRNITLIS